MVDIFDRFESKEYQFIRDLAEDLEGTFLMLAYAGFSNDRNYLEETRKHFERRYAKLIPYVYSKVFSDFISPAYEILEIILDEKDPKFIEQLAEEGLNYLNIGNDELTEDLFEEYESKTHVARTN